MATPEPAVTSGMPRARGAELQQVVVGDRVDNRDAHALPRNSSIRARIAPTPAPTTR